MRSRLPAAVPLAVALLCAGAWAHAQGRPACGDCHGEVAKAMSGARHMRVQPFEVGGRTVGCEGCHGDGTRHMAEGDPAAIRNFKGDGDSTACLECHRGRGQSEWHASTHAAEGVSCTECHSVHGAEKASAANGSCVRCHAAEVAQFRLPSHHPLNEGRVSCGSCHDPHAATEKQLRTRGRANDLCATCHLGKEGPYLFEHQPVQEDCGQCHQPHGSVARRLLNANEPMLCMQCHEPHFHGGYAAADGEIDIGGIPRESTNGVDGLTRAFNTKCTQCHSQIHGSDLPGQGITSRGNGLVR